MSIKSKSKKRLVVLFCAAVIVIGGGAGAYVFHKFQVRRELASERADGLAAATKNDYPTAVENLDKYLSMRPNDIEALKTYVRVRPFVGAGTSDEVKAELGELRRLVILDPSDTDARQQLMGLFWHYGYVPEAEEQAQALLKTNPKDADALKYLLLAKLRNRGEDMLGSKEKHIPSAQEIAERWAAAAPDDPTPDFMILGLMQQNSVDPTEILAKAKELGGKNTDSPMAEMILAEAYRITNDRSSAIQELKKAAAQPLPSNDLAKTLAGQLNQLGLYHDSLAFLKKQANGGKDPAISEDLAKRQWEAGKPDQVIALTNGIEDKLSIEGKAIRAMSLRAVGKASEADAIQSQLAQDTTPLGTAWATILQDMSKTKTGDAKQIVDVCQNALRTSAAARDPYLLFFLGEAYEQLGERELATDALTKAAQQNPTWVLPLLRLSALELQRQRPGVAMEAAEVAWQRSQDSSAAAAIAIAKAWQAVSEINERAAGANASGPPAKLVSLVDEIHQKLPGEEQTTAMYISLLCQSKPSKIAQAKEEIHKALENKKATQEGLIRLAAISRQYNLGVTDEAFAAAESRFGVTPALAYAEAVTQYFSGDPSGAVKLFENKRAKAKSGNALDWDMAHARLLELTHDPRAADAWIALGDANPGNLMVQQTLLGIGSVQSKREFLQRTIDRVKKLTGNDAITWKIASARLALQGNPSQQDLADTSLQLKQIINQAPDLADAYALLGECYERLGNMADALTQLQTALQKDPRNVALALFYTRLLEQHGDLDKARTVLAALPTVAITDPQRREAAQLMAREGDAKKASDMLASGGGNDVENELMLATLDRQQNHMADAEALVTKMMEHPSAQAIAFAADFYASQKKMDQAQKALAMLNNLKLAPGEADMVRGEFAAHFKSLDEAVADFKAGLAAAPDNVMLWTDLVRINLAAGKGDAAKAALSESASKVPNDPGLAVLRTNANLLASLCASPGLRPSVMAVAADPRSDNPVLAALKIIGSAQQQKQPMGQMTASLQTLLDQNPRSWPLRELMIQTYLETGDKTSANHAAQLAMEGMQMFPGDVNPVRLAAESLLAAGKTSEAVGYLKIWHDKTPGNSMAADLMSARAYMALGRPQDAADADRPYAALLMGNPEAGGEDFLVYAAALNETGDSDQVAKAIWPLAVKDPAWRTRWVALAMHCNTTQVATQWLEKITPLIGKDDTQASLALVDAWHALAMRTGNQTDAQNAQAILTGLSKRTDLSGETLQTLGVLDEQLNNPTEAEAMYRRAIQAKPDLAIALNNLAMLMARHQGDSGDSLALAKRAVEAAPKMATIHDTLAFVEAQHHEYDQAENEMSKAIGLDSGNMLWYVHQAKYYWEGGKHQAAQNLATKISGMQPTDDAAGKQSLREWEALKAEMGKQANAQ